jgi:WD40 repeat protein
VLSRDDRFAFTAGWDETIRWWQMDKGREWRSASVSGHVVQMTLSPDGRTVLAATDEGKLRTWDAATGTENTPVSLKSEVKIDNFSFTPDGKHLVAASGPKVTIWDWPTMKLIRTIDMPKPVQRDDFPENCENHCQVVNVSPDGKWLVSVAVRSCTTDRDGLRYTSMADGWWMYGISPRESDSGGWPSRSVRCKTADLRLMASTS